MAKESKDKAAGSKGQRSWFQGVKAEFNKIVWTDRNTLIKQTIVVILVSIILCAIISVMDAAILEGINLIMK